LIVYEILKNAPEAPMPLATPKTPERVAMEQLEVGDAFVVKKEGAMLSARTARYRLKPKMFTVRQLADGEGWQVRRVA
jgi:hypothetical protein